MRSPRDDKPSDIVDRLRKPNGVTDWAAMLEAANLIVRLRGTSAPERPAFNPPQVTLLEAAEALLARMDESLNGTAHRLYGEADVLRQAIQRERAK